MAKFGQSLYISTGETQEPRRSKATNQSIGSHLSGIPEMPCRSTEAIAQCKQTWSVNIFVPPLEFTKSLDRKQTSTLRNEKQRLYASVLRSTGRRKAKKSEKRKQIAQAKTTLMPPW